MSFLRRVYSLEWQILRYYCILILEFIANTEKYLQFDWLRGVQYWPYLYSVFNTCTLEREKNNIRFFLP